VADNSVKQIKHARQQEEVNAYLQAGWVYLGMTPGTTEEGSPWPLYTLGWTQDVAPEKVKPTW